YHGMVADEQAQERQRQQDLLARARQYRADATDQAQMGMQRQQLAMQEADSEQDRLFRVRQLQQQAEIAKRPQFQQVGNVYGQVDPTTGTFAQQGELPQEQVRRPDYTIGNVRYSGETNQPLVTGPQSPTSTEQEWVLRDGQPTPIAKGTAKAGDRPYDPIAMRNQPDPTGPSPYAAERATRTIQSVQELKASLAGNGRWVVGGLSDFLAFLPESEARYFRGQLQTLKSSIAFNELTAMREASKTGGALGNVSNIELALLENALGSLDAAQSPQQFAEQLTKIENSIKRWQDAVKAHGSSGGKNRIRVRNKATGQTGTISESAFDPAKYEKL
ncbi:MAG TPA: hypothetical protein VD994_19225, partial [Prosthecobacter sp.]|nr:hypothetical protein [Prosthecobacter sp.]